MRLAIVNGKAYLTVCIVQFLRNYWKPHGLVKGSIGSLNPPEVVFPAVFGKPIVQWRIRMVEQLLPDQIQALATAHIEGLVNNLRLKELTSLHSADISKMLQRLCDDGYLVSDNKKRWSSYRLNQSEVSNSSLSEGNSSLSDKKKRLPKQYMEKLIMDICQNKFQTLSDIAGKLNRNPRSLRNNYLSEMVKKGILELKHSNTPNNPNQAYRTVRR